MENKQDISGYHCITFPKSLYNNRFTYEMLNKLYSELNSITTQKILFDMSNTEFFAANLFSILGCILEELHTKRLHSFTFFRIDPKIQNVMQRNNFGNYFSIPHLPDINNTTIEYRIFNATTDNLEEFEKYTLNNVMNRSNMPRMSAKVKKRITENILEIFNNVIDHAETSNAYICGQYFVKKHKLVITITDLGKTIKENVTKFLKTSVDKAVQWAIIPGNSTKSSAPGGLGISILLDFLKLNKGFFTLISDDECLEITNEGEQFVRLINPFPGTIVSITFNMKDDFSYIMNSEKNEEIIF